MSWFTNLNIKSQVTILAASTAAIVAGLFSIITVVLRDFLVTRIKKKSDAEETSNEVFRKYAEPLAAFSTTLFWRLRETLAQDGRGFYLSAVEPRSTFELYKLYSTYDRLAALLGCIRGLQKELLYFRVKQERMEAIETSLNDFEKALADGHEVELQRLKGFLVLWNALVTKKEDEVHVAVDIERVKRT